MIYTLQCEGLLTICGDVVNIARVANGVKYLSIPPLSWTSAAAVTTFPPST
jgi:hypothetical protein